MRVYVPIMANQYSIKCMIILRKLLVAIKTATAENAKSRNLIISNFSKLFHSPMF